MKKLAILLSIVLIIAGCTPQYDSEEEVVQDDPEETEDEQRQIIPNRISDNDYQTIVPYKPNVARGTITDQVSNSYDVDELELGLIRHAKGTFSPDDYLFQEGQYLDEGMILEWIDDLNPPDKNSDDREYHEENPRIFSHVLEHNYLVRSDDNRVELGGIAIGIALKSEYNFKTEVGGPTFSTDISQKEMLEEGKEIADSLLSRIREVEELQDVPVMIALYRQNSNNAIVPGHFVAKAEVEPLAQNVDGWTNINENHVLFPSNEAETDYYDQYEIMNEFTQEVQDFFPNYTGVIGRGFYSNNELRKMSINIPIEFYGQQEVVAFSQHLYSLVMEYFPNTYDVEVTVESPNKQEALIFRNAGQEEPSVHIYE
ncbi:CamS family sex pheromone protein [Piscibacillus halophilus]|uniref:Protein involved in sex pheromone biosynthesis n=1 Tax=Piscibacillus halophilus TaxID=571933 RepID=A0A1H9G7I1_9BACI|nr:CamS family sex pheromone protein [Piscibacillus halophilus]SEQ46086.1 Protein involved in sex pheromone biosynthesis [Piscibacillus halophilus]